MEHFDRAPTLSDVGLAQAHVRTPAVEDVCGDLGFPEGGPIYLDDGSLLLVEIRRGWFVYYTATYTYKL
jgi:hypothetical protein